MSNVNINIDIIIYGKKECSTCEHATSILTSLKSKYITKIYISIVDTLDIHNATHHVQIQKYCSVPFIFVNDVYIGGCRELLSWKKTHFDTTILTTRYKLSLRPTLFEFPMYINTKTIKSISAGSHNTTHRIYTIHQQKRVLLYRRSKETFDDNNELVNFNKEITIAILMSSHKIGPYIYEAYVDKNNHGIIIMDLYYSNLENFLRIHWKSYNIVRMVCTKLVHIIEHVTNIGILCIDQKPCNVVVSHPHVQTTSGWINVKSKRTGKNYYYNTHTQDSQYTYPINATVDDSLFQLRLIDFGSDFCYSLDEASVECGVTISTSVARVIMLVLQCAQSIKYLQLNYLCKKTREQYTRLSNIEMKYFKTILNTWEILVNIVSHYDLLDTIQMIIPQLI
jgi:glutaredoxin